MSEETQVQSTQEAPSMPVKFDHGDTKISRGEVYRVDPRIIVMPEDFNGRHFGVTDAEIDDMVKSLKTGQLQPIQCKRRPQDNKLEVYAGFTRLKAAMRIVEEDPNWLIQTFVDPNISAEGTFIANVTENLKRNRTSVVDDSHNIHRLINTYGKDADFVRDLYGLSAGKFAEVRRIRGLPEAMQRKLHEGKIALSAALATLKLDEAKQKEIIEELESEPAPTGETVVVGDPAPVETITTGDAPAEPAKKKRGRPKKETAAKPKKAPKKVKAKDVQEKLRESGNVIRRTASDLRKVLDGREDAVSKAIFGYLKGSVDAETLLAELDAADDRAFEKSDVLADDDDGGAPVDGPVVAPTDDLIPGDGEGDEVPVGEPEPAAVADGLDDL